MQVQSAFDDCQLSLRNGVLDTFCESGFHEYTEWTHREGRTKTGNEARQ